MNIQSTCSHPTATEMTSVVQCILESATCSYNTASSHSYTFPWTANSYTHMIHVCAHKFCYTFIFYDGFVQILCKQRIKRLVSTISTYMYSDHTFFLIFKFFYTPRLCALSVRFFKFHKPSNVFFPMYLLKTSLCICGPVLFQDKL